MYITYDSLIAEARKGRGLARLVTQHLFSGVPFVFQGNPAHYDILRKHLASSLIVPEASITIVGSARLGYSLNPSHPGNPLRDTSDIDVIIADEKLFDRIWEMLLRWRYPWRLAEWPKAEHEWVTGHLESVFAGYFLPHNLTLGGLKPRRSRGRANRSMEYHRDAVLQLRHDWFTAFKTTSRYPELGHREFKGRLYRSWAFATTYHIHGLQKLALSA
jgi:hypothetical protein